MPASNRRPLEPKWFQAHCSPQQHFVVDERAQRVAAPRRNHVLWLEVLDAVQVGQVDCNWQGVEGRAQ